MANKDWENLIGADCEMYYAAEGSSSYTPILKVRDNDLQVEANEVDDTTRDDDGWSSTRHGLKGWTCSFDMLYDKTNTAWTALRDAFLNGNPQNFAILDDTSAKNGEGIIGGAIVTSFGRGEPIGDNVTTTVTLKSRGKPTWGTI